MSFGKVLIFGDSYSTFNGWIPEGNAYYYPPTLDSRPIVDKVEETWWHSLITETGSELVLNESWSGSTIGYTGYGGADTSKTSSFIIRLRRMLANGFFDKEKIDTVFVFGGTNDSWSDAPVGELKFENRTEADLYFVLPGICEFFEGLKTALPNARIICLINSDLKDKITEDMKSACKHYRVEYLALSDIDKKSDHPTVLGMKAIKEQILKTF